MKNAKRKLSLKMADGGMVTGVIARPVSPFSIKGIANNLSAGYGNVVDAASHGIEAVAKPFARPVGYTPALAPAPAPAAALPAPAPALPQLGGVNLDVIQRREAAAGLADGAPIVAPRPVSPFSIKGIGQGLASGYDSLVGHTADLMEAAHNTFGRPAGYTPAVLPATPAAPTAAPVGPAPTIGGAVNAIQAHQQELANLADGAGIVRGKGGPIDDKVPAKLSHGESVLPADTTAIVGPENIQRLIDETHTPAQLQKQGVPPGGRHVARQGLRLANGIAGLDVTESPFTESDARLFGQRPAGTAPTPQPQIPGMEVTHGTGIADPGPGNPNVSRVGPQRPMGPQSVAEPAPSTTMARPGAASAATEAAEAGGLAYRTGRLAATGLRMAPQALLAGELMDNIGTTKVSNDVAPVDASAMGTLRYVANGDFDNAGESLRKGAVEAGGDLLKAGAGFGDIFLPGTPLTDAVNNRLRSDLGAAAAPNAADSVGAGRGRINPPTVQPAAIQPAVAPAAQPTAPPLDNSVIPGGAQAGKIMRRGNSFTNAGTFAEDAAPGSISAQNDAAATALSNRSRAESLASSGLRGGMDTNLPAGYGATVPGQNGVPASQYEAELAARNASVHSMDEGRGMNANQRAAHADAQAQIAASRENSQRQDSTARRGQDVNAEVARAGQRVSLRGQDLTYAATTRGQDMTSRTAAAQARMEQMNKDRQYHFDVAKHGDEVAKQNFEMRQSAEKGVHEQIANMLPPGPDGKPDTATAARYATGLNAIVAEHQQALQQRAAAGDKRAEAALDDLSKHGIAALDQGTIRRFVNGMKAKDLSDQYASSRFNPVGGTGTITDTPAAGLRKTSNGFLGFGGEYSLVDANGRPTGATVPARAVEGDGSFVGGRRRTDLRDFVQ